MNTHHLVISRFPFYFGLFAFLFSVSVSITNAREPGHNTKGHSLPITSPAATQNSAPGSIMPVVVPLFIEDRHFTSTLVLINGISSSTFADVVVRDPHGEEIARQRVQFAPHSQQRVNIAQLLLVAGSRATSGSITIMQNPARKSMQLAQLTMTFSGSRNLNYLDEEISMPSAEGSSILRGVADSSDRSPLVAITSLAEAAQNVRVECLGSSGSHPTPGARFTKSVQLLPGETLLTEACTNRTVHGGDLETALGDDEDDSRESRAVGVALTSDAMLGSFAAFGLVPHGTGDDRFFSGFTLDDPKMIVSSTKIFTGVPVDSANLLPEGRFVPHVSLANFSAKPSHAVIKYSQMIGSSPSAREVAQVTVPGNSTKELALDMLEGDADMRNSFVVSSDASPGDFSVKLVAKSDSQLREVELEAKDERDTMNGGNHPWSLENGTESTLLLFNHSNEAQLFNVLISAGTMVWSKPFTLAPMETQGISIRALIQEKVKDRDGQVLPPGALSGEVLWFAFVPGVGKGRVLQSNRSDAMARNFSCGAVSVLCDASLSGEPGVLGLPFGVGTTVQFGLLKSKFCLSTQGPDVCSGEHAGSATAQTYSWVSANPAIAAMSGVDNTDTGFVVGVSPGTTKITGTVQAGVCKFPGSGNANIGLKILMGGCSGTDITGKSQTVVVGQL